jgi:hypothetical protein
MSKDKNASEQNKVKEPYTPESTPTPPQTIDPSRKPEEELKNNREEPVKKGNAEKPGETKEGKKLLGESETEVTDETTI